MPRINIQNVDAAARHKFPREFSILQQLDGGSGVDSEVRASYYSDLAATATVTTNWQTTCRP